ncbi:sugar porter family MFS transporter [Coniochaeta ligniaria NRRL 30616]|uniref:Sugar porter family MFS transporter n=1 Tax=Coniochaeta ligniaria NRRL 30616 TaxID=1408157 RepID=A0A1J7JXV3_9PEZI|nr:sugar porter family MFS transporter [Coniochaeta ligniaria NRRL 30616]
MLKSFNRYNLAIVLFTALGSYTYGFNSSIIASVTGLPSFFDYLGLTSEGLRAAWSAEMIGAMNSLYSAGGLIGALSVGWLADRLGRKRSIQLICGFCVIASIFTTASVSIAMFLVGRTLQVIDTICPLYQSEVSPAHARGRMVGMHAFFLVLGYAGSSWIGLGCYFATNPNVQWRLCLAFQILAPLCLLCGSKWLPESPRFLIYNGKMERGLAVLKKLHSSSGDPSSSFAEAEFTQIQRQVELDRHSELSWIGLWKNPGTRKRLLCGFFVIAAAQSSGVLVINNYQIILYTGLGITGWRALLLLSIYTSWAALMNWVNAMLLDRVGRIKLMVIGMTGAALAVSCETAIVAKFAGTNNAVGNGFGIFFLFLFITFFASGMDACNVYLAEIFPTWMRAQGVAFSVSGLFTTTLIYTGAASAAFAEVGWKYYLVFIFVPLACVLIIWFYLPETNGPSLEEIGLLFGDEVAAHSEELSSKLNAQQNATISGVEVLGLDSEPETNGKTKVEKQ